VIKSVITNSIYLRVLCLNDWL